MDEEIAFDELEKGLNLKKKEIRVVSRISSQLSVTSGCNELRGKMHNPLHWKALSNSTVAVVLWPLVYPVS